ncbi:phage head spike fiber domain-containing protein [Pseudogemmobacter sp. W21_MBD1_M6]|uniref:phage head spike fiber domain-containing protein n=1 Tax=Pseudogemmobacter sp. W21_MBD1_M6 TaxID=3240271 RepID=UPI003F9D27B1
MKTAVRFISNRARQVDNIVPSGLVPVALWDFESGQYDRPFSVSRASPASFLSQQGTLDIAAPDTLRFGWSQGRRFAILEAASTNLLVNSVAGVSGGWTASGAAATGLALAAMGVFPGVSVVGNGAAWNRLLHSNKPPCSSGSPLAITVWLRAGSSGRARIILRDNVGSTETHIAGAVSGMTAEASAAGGVSNLSRVLQPDGVTTRLAFVFTPSFSGTLSLGIGPDSVVLGETLVVLGAQIEVGTKATRLIPTAGTAATRAADVLELSPPNGAFDVRITRFDGSFADGFAVQINAPWVPALDSDGIRSIALYPSGALV